MGWSLSLYRNALLLLLLSALPVCAQTAGNFTTNSRPIALATSNTEIPAACEIIWRNAPEIFCMKADGTNLTQLTVAQQGIPQFDHMAVSPQRGHIAASYVDADGVTNHLLLFDLANDTVTALVPHFQSAGFGGVDWDLQGYIYFAGREHAPYALDTAVVEEARANAGAYEIWRVKYDGTGLEKLTDTSTHGEADVAVSEDGSRIIYAATRIVEGYAEIWVAPAVGGTASLVYQSTVSGETVHDPELSPDNTNAVFSKRDPNQPDQFGIKPQEIVKCVVATCAATLTQLTPAGNGPIQILPDWRTAAPQILFAVLEDDGTPYTGPAVMNDDGTGTVRILDGPQAAKWIPSGSAPALPAATVPDIVAANLLVANPSFGIHGNSANDGAVTTEAAYLANASAKVTAVTKANNLGTDHHDLTIKWSAIEATVGNYTWTRIDEIANNSTQPLILNIAPIWDDGTKTVPSDIAGVDWDSASMSNAYKNLLSTLKARHPGRIWQIGVGNEADVYFGSNPTQVAKYATFLTNIRTHARTQFGVNPFALTMSFRFAARTTLLTTYAALMNQLDFPSITYYATATSDASALAQTISSDLQSVQVALGGARTWFLSEVGFTTDSPASESVQQTAFYAALSVVPHLARQFGMRGLTWYQLSDVSSAVRTSFGATSYGERSGIGIRDTANAAKDIEPMVALFLGGVTDTPPSPPPNPQPPLEPQPLTPEDGVTVNNPVLITWSDEPNTTFALFIGPSGQAPTRIDLGGAASYSFTGTPGVTYPWYVQACNIVGCKDQSVQHRTFTITPPPLPPPSNLTITFPTDGATGVPLNPTVSWTSTGATLYRLRAGTVNPPTTEVYSGTVGQFTITANVNNTVYYLSVDAINASGSVTASSSFRTETAAGVATHPVLMITAGRQTAWNAMKTDYDASATTPKCTDGAYTEAKKIGCGLYKTMLDKIAAGTYADHGLEYAMLSRITGRNAASDCANAYTRSGTGGLLAINPTSSVNINVLREHAIDWPLVYDLCYDQWNTTQRDTYLTKLNELFTFTIFRAGNTSWTTHYCGNVDQQIGEYFGLLLYYFATKDYNPTAVSLFNNARVGGLTPTTLKCEPQTMVTVNDGSRSWRNMVAYYYANNGPAEGGAWFEGMEYVTSAFLGMMGCAALDPIVAADAACTEIRAWESEHADFLTHWLARDSGYAQSASDDENGHDLWESGFQIHMMKTYHALTGLLADGSTRQHLYKVLQNFRAANPTKKDPDITFAGRAAIMANPYITAAADLSALPNCYRAQGYGYYLWNDGVLTTDSQFMVHLRPEARGIDHFANYWGNVGLYRRSQYALTNPVSYAGASSIPEGTNTSMVEGLIPPSFAGRQFKGETGYTCGSDFLYIAGTAGGTHFIPSSDATLLANSTYDNTTLQAVFNPPAVFIHEWTKSFVYLPSATKTYDNIVTIERINAVDPLTTFRGANWTTVTSTNTCYPNCLDHLYLSRKNRIDNRPRWTRFQHQWFDPTVASNVVTWTLPDGQTVTDTWLAPDAVTITKEATANLVGFNVDGIVKPPERKWRTTTQPTSDTQWNCLFDVVSARNSGSAAPTLTELTVTNNGAGVLITRTGNDDRVVVANCGQGPSFSQNYPSLAQTTTQLSTARYRAAGSYTVSYTQTTATAKVLLLDLNPALSWAYTLNGGASTPITEDASGLEELSIGGGAGVKTLVITGS